VESGCSLLTVHGRTKEQNKDKVGSCDWKIIKKIKESINIPVVANGGIHTFEDAEQCIKQTGVDGVMSAEALLENPALFSGEVHCLDTIAE
jgi:tRNA-dihydrouridine synthase 1